MTSSKMYYIMSVKNTGHDEMVLWFRPNCSGYTHNIDEAGIYPEDEVREKPWYYNDGKVNVAVPCDVVRAMSIMITPNNGQFEAEILRQQRVWHRNKLDNKT
jgi:hypothetical protein